MTLTQRSTGLRFRLLALLGVFLCGGLRAVAAESIEVVVAGRLHSLTEVTSEARPYLRAMRFNAAQRVWNVDLSVTNTSGGSLAGPLVVLVESFGGITDVLEKDGVLEGSRARPYFVVATGALAPEQGTPARTLSLGYRPEAPRMELRVFAAIGTEPHPLAVVRTLDAVGQPLPGIRVTETWNGTSRDLVTDARFGIATLGGREGDYRWRFESEGYLPVWRSAMLREGGVTVVTAPRLVPRPSEFAVVGTAGGVVSNSAAGLRVMVPAGAVADGTQIRLAPLTGQTLPAWLPRGWSPMQAFWLGATPAVTSGLTVDLRPWGTIGTDERAWLVRWDPAQFGWVVTASIAGKGAAFLSAALRQPEVELSREAVYRDWLAQQFGIAAELLECHLQEFRLASVIRRAAPASQDLRPKRSVKGPDAVLSGKLQVGDDAAFAQLLRRGVGRHRAFGYGMLLLKPLAMHRG